MTDCGLSAQMRTENALNADRSYRSTGRSAAGEPRRSRSLLSAAMQASEDRHLFHTGGSSVICGIREPAETRSSEVGLPSRDGGRNVESGKRDAGEGRPPRRAHAARRAGRGGRGGRMGRAGGRRCDAMTSMVRRRGATGRRSRGSSRALESTWSHLPCTCLIRCHRFCRR